MRDVTLVLPHYCNLGMLAEQRRVWASYASELRRHLHVVVVDDCSPKAQRPDRKSFSVPAGIGSVRLYRLLEKKRWNWLACRNLGAEQSETNWLLLTDIDHVVPESTLRRVMTGELDAANAYRFSRVTATGVWPYAPDSLPPYKPHNDSWLIARALFFDDRVGGYDERLSGCYGTSGEFTDRLTAATRARIQLPERLVRYPREVIPDASTLPEVYTRKNDPKNDTDLQRRKTERARIAEWRPLRGTIPWERLI